MKVYIEVRNSSFNDCDGAIAFVFENKEDAEKLAVQLNCYEEYFVQEHDIIKHIQNGKINLNNAQNNVD